jgi:hypothetical protein
MHFSISIALFIYSIARHPSCAVLVSDNPHPAPAVETIFYSTCITPSHDVADPVSTIKSKHSNSVAISTKPTTTFTLIPSTIIPFSTSYMIVVNKWRSRIGKSVLAHDTKLESNAMDTVRSSNGVMAHKLNKGTFAQVVAQYKAKNFEEVFVGGWLCEMAGLPGLEGICTALYEGWTYNGQTGHAEILISDSYSRIGCAVQTDIWSCDLA